MVAILIEPAAVAAQLAPEMGYVFPSGGQAGTTVDVKLGGYDWTPDLQYVVHDPRITFEILGPPGETIVAGPPYWFGPKGRAGALPIPREVAARITIPADMPPGPVLWQVANANGVSAAGKFFVSTETEVIETRRRNEPQQLPTLPITVSGRLEKIQEVDRYRILAAKAGPVHCELFAKRLGSGFNSVLAIHDAEQQLIADSADTIGTDTGLIFAAQAGEEYIISVYDLDFRGNRAFVYRLHVSHGPQVIAAVPAVGQRGQTQQVQFFGYGVATGGSDLETVTQEVTFPGDAKLEQFDYRLDSPHGTSRPFQFRLSDTRQTTAPTTTNEQPHRITVPAGVTGTLAAGTNDDHYRLSGKKDEAWSISLKSCGSESPLDLVLTVNDLDGKELAKNDDLPGTNDAGLQFTVPADGEYHVVVSSLSGAASEATSIYHLAVARQEAGFTLTCPDRFVIPIGTEKAELTVNAVRSGGFKEPIKLELTGLPQGVTATGELVIPADKQELKIALTSAKDAPSTASLVKITGNARLGDSDVTREAGPLLVASTMKPRAKITPVDKDGGRTVHRGTTFAAPVIIERLEGFEGEVLLEMSARQGRHRQGIRGPELVVPPEVTRIEYPVFMPEWLETSRTSRMVVNAIAKVPDPQGQVRYLSNKMVGRITMSLEGALLKISHQAKELQAHPGKPFDVPITVSRSAKLREPARVELQPGAELAGLLSAEPIVLGVDQQQAVLRVQSSGDNRLEGEYRFTVRATSMQHDTLPVISETIVDVAFIRRDE